MLTTFLLTCVLLQNRLLSPTDYYVMLFVVAALGFTMEALNAARSELANKQGHFYEELADLPGPSRKSTLRFLRLVSVFLYFMSLLLGYMLMLAAMTYNAGIFFAVILGMTAGFYFLRTDSNGRENTSIDGAAGHCGSLE